MKKFFIFFGVCMALILFGLNGFTQNVPAGNREPGSENQQQTPDQIIQSLNEQLTRLNNDWANLSRYKEDNEMLAPPSANDTRVVFMGNSITEGWGRIAPEFFEGRDYINRGISGQTTPQMLVRFRPDVIELQPRVVVILAGTNDIAGNTGPATLEEIFGNIVSMCQLAEANGIKVVLSSVLPALDYYWRPGLEPAEKIVALNKMIKSYADEKDYVYLDFFSAMVNDKLGMLEAYTMDGIHPNAAGYAVMGPLAEKAIAEALK